VLPLTNILLTGPSKETCSSMVQPPMETTDLGPMSAGSGTDRFWDRWSAGGLWVLWSWW